MKPEMLIKKRTECGLSQIALANRADVSRFKISIFETGEGELTKEEIVAIEKVLKKGNRSAANKKG